MKIIASFHLERELSIHAKSGKNVLLDVDLNFLVVFQKVRKIKKLFLTGRSQEI